MFRRKTFRVRLPSCALSLGQRTTIMGVLNVTPNSFSDGGLYLDTTAAVARALEIQRAGADILDIGAESTRPGAAPIPADEELKRLIPVLEKLRGRLRIPISIDTSKPEVAIAAVAAGAQMINDVSALRNGPALAEIARHHKLALILMHMRGEPLTMQKKSFARNVMLDVTASLRASVRLARRAGLPKSQIILDPGIGFGKSDAQNFELLARLPELAKLGYPLLVGTSRKGFIGRALGGASAKDRIWGTAATVTASILAGAHIVRVHDVAEMAQVARVTDLILHPASAPSEETPTSSSRRES